MWRYRLRKLLSLSRRELVDLLAAQTALLTAQFEVRTRPKGRLVAASGSGSAQGAEASDSVRAEAQRLSLAVQRAAEHGLFRPTCLVRSVALQRMLWRRGHHAARIQIGVQPGDDNLQAHAWVELGDLVLGDQTYHVQRFEPFGSVNVLHR